jgi:hypothetical protein
MVVKVTIPIFYLKVQVKILLIMNLSTGTDKIAFTDVISNEAAFFQQVII